MNMDYINNENTPMAKGRAAAPEAYSKANNEFDLNELIELRTVHDAWHSGAYKTSNNELYSILAKMFRYLSAYDESSQSNYGICCRMYQPRL